MVLFILFPGMGFSGKNWKKYIDFNKMEVNDKTNKMLY